MIVVPVTWRMCSPIPGSLPILKCPRNKRIIWSTPSKTPLGSQSVEQRGQWAVAQTYISLGFLLLAAQEKGYDTSAMLGFDPEKVKALFQLPDHVRIAALVALGKGTEPGRPHHRHSLDRIATFV